MDKNTITRFAPSPTGPMHIGNARTALFSYLYARKMEGKFYFRIEDTDRERYDAKSEGQILDNLDWLGIKFDKFGEDTRGYLIQSERLDKYRQIANELVEKGIAYKCYCTKQRLEELRKKQSTEGKPTIYDRRCCDATNPNDSSEFVVRLKIPQDEIIEFNDLVRGKISFAGKDLDDSVLLKSDGFPTYHLAAAVDDHEMGVTHVLRAEEWLSSTPKHIVIYKAMDWNTPEFGHFSLILGADKTKLSKRHGATSVRELRDQGYLPEALVNFMALLGWNPKSEEELFTLSELEDRFDLEGINRAPAVFDIEKLNYFNRYYIAKSENKKLIDLLRINTEKTSLETAEKIVELVKQRMDKLSDFNKLSHYFFTPPKIITEDLVFIKSTKSSAKKGLEIAAKELEKAKKIDKLELKSAFESAVLRNKISNGDLFWSLRFTLTGEKKSPPPEEIIPIIGRQEALERINSAVELLK